MPVRRMNILQCRPSEPMARDVCTKILIRRIPTMLAYLLADQVGVLVELSSSYSSRRGAPILRYQEL